MILTVGDTTVKVPYLFKKYNKLWSDIGREFHVPKSLGFKIVNSFSRKKIWDSNKQKYLYFEERLILKL